MEQEEKEKTKLLELGTAGSVLEQSGIAFVVESQEPLDGSTNDNMVKMTANHLQTE